jgi:molybdopterin converting factor small subunit
MSGSSSPVDLFAHESKAQTRNLSGNPPAVHVELYGSLRMRSGQASIALRANSIRTALSLLVETLPELKRLLPTVEELPLTHRFSVNGHTVTTDLDTPLHDGDHLVLFSASVGG